MSQPEMGIDDDLETSDEIDELVPLIQSQAEDESDLDLAEDADNFSASVAGKDWTVETLVSQMRKGRIDLDPSFQRRNAWLDKRKSKLIESVLLGYPIPQIVLAEQRERPGYYFVLDGKQRLLALRQFFSTAEGLDADFVPLTLSGLEILTELNRSTARTLEDELEGRFAALENHTIRTVVLSNWNSERLLLSLFLRLNTGSVQLSPQELRQALIPGDFVRWLDDTSGRLTPLLRLLGSSLPDRRMVDAELLLRYLAFSFSPLTYRGNLKQFLDETCRTFNDTWADSAPILEAGAQSLSDGIEAAQLLFGNEHACRKWTKNKYERAVNRAVFDVMAYSLGNPTVAAASVGKADEFVSSYEHLCNTSTAFVRSISSTTKTRDAFRTRHRTWQRAVQETLDVRYELPPPLTRELTG